MRIIGWREHQPGRTLTEARYYNAIYLVLLLLGGTGLFSAIACVFLIFEFQDGLLKWLEQGKVREGREFILASFGWFASMLLMFVASQPLRRQERQMSGFRRLLYGYSTVLTAILVLAVLVIANIIYGFKGPKDIDMTSGKIFSMDPVSIELIQGINKPVHAYLIFPSEYRFYRDLRKLLEHCAELNSNFHFTYFDPSTETDAVIKLYQRLKLIDTSKPGSQRLRLDSQDYGILLSTGENETQTSLISIDKLISSKGSRDNPNQPPILQYQGEVKVMNELAFLLEDKVKPIVYFTQGHGEIDMSDAQNTNRLNPLKGTRLKKYLEEHNFEVRTWESNLGTVPKLDDATIVVILGADKDFTPQELGALREYIRNDKRRKGAAGKLMICLSAHANPVDKKVLKTNLDQLLNPLDIHFDDHFVLQQPAKVSLFNLPPQLALMGAMRLEDGGALENLTKRYELFFALLARKIEAGNNRKGPNAIHWQPLLTLDRPRNQSKELANRSKDDLSNEKRSCWRI